MKKLYPINVKLIILTGAFLMSVTGHQLEAQTCGSAQGNPATYGTNNVWIGYVYTGMTLSSANYQGDFTVGTASSPNFNTTFTSSGTFTPSGCSINTTNFSVRYRLTQSYSSGTYVITVGGGLGGGVASVGGPTGASAPAPLMPSPNLPPELSNCSGTYLAVEPRCLLK